MKFFVPWKQNWGKTETELVGSVLLEKAEESILAHSGYQLHVQPLLPALYKHPRCLGTDLPKITDSSCLWWTVSNLSNTSETFLVCPSAVTGMQYLSITWCCCISTRSNHSIKDLLYLLFFFAPPMHNACLQIEVPVLHAPSFLQRGSILPWDEGRGRHPEKSRAAHSTARRNELPFLCLPWSYLKAGLKCCREIFFPPT